MRLQELIEKLQDLPTSALTARVDVVTHWKKCDGYQEPVIKTPQVVRYEAGTVVIELVQR